MDIDTTQAGSPIILVDDDSDGITLTSSLLRRSGIPRPVNAMPSAIDLLERLQQERECIDGSPRVIIMDLHMPGLSGFEALHWIRSQGWLDRVFVAIISSSAHELDVQTAAQLGAGAYIERYPSLAALRSLFEFVKCNELSASPPARRPFFHLRAAAPEQAPLNGP